MNYSGEPSNCDVRDLRADLDLSDAIIRFSRSVQDVLIEASGRHELTSVQARLLGTLTKGPLSMGDLAQLLGVERAAITGLVDRAQKLGYVTREPVPHDRRATHVTLTGLGRRLGSRVHQDVKQELDARVSRLGAEDQLRLLAMITQLGSV